MKKLVIVASVLFVFAAPGLPSLLSHVVAGGAGYVIGKSGSGKEKTVVVVDSKPKNEYRFLTSTDTSYVVILSLPSSNLNGNATYDASCGKVKLRREVSSGWGCTKYVYDYLEVPDYLKKIYPSKRIICYDINYMNGLCEACRITVSIHK